MVEKEQEVAVGFYVEGFGLRPRVGAEPAGAADTVVRLDAYAFSFRRRLDAYLTDFAKRK